MRFETRQHRHRREVTEAGFTDQWRTILADNMAHWALLDDDERERLGNIAVEFLATKRWEAAQGFELTDEVTMLISAEASLLVLERPPDSFREVSSIVIHPTTMVLGGSHSQVSGLASDDPMPIIGQASPFGPVLVAWDAASFQARHPEQGSNVVFHEFAHKLDMLTGTTNGTPPMDTAEQEQRWVTACTETYHRVVAGQSRVLRPYAGVNTAEFFAVATEAFFDTPGALAAEEPALYEVLMEWFGQDPASRKPRP